MQSTLHAGTRKLFLHWPMLLLPLLLILVVSVFAFHAVGHIDSLTSPAPRSRTNTQLGDCLAAKLGSSSSVTAAEVQACEQKLPAEPLDDPIKPRIDELKWMLTMIGSLCAFFVIAQGGAAFFSALVYTRQAEKSLADILAIEEDINSRYPVFRSIEEQRSLALMDLAQDVATTSSADNPLADPTEVMDYNFKNILYSSMSVRNRQRLLSLESFASIDLHPGPQGAAAYPENLRRFALFYQSKFQYEKRSGSAAFADLERAESYLRLAVEKSNSDFTLLNDLSVLCLEMHKVFHRTSNSPKEAYYLAEAATACRRSLLAQPEQQRAYYNLGVLHGLYEEPRDYAAACGDLVKALNYRNWQRFQAPAAVQSLVHYNLGCYRAQLLAQDKSQAVFTLAGADDCLAALREAARLGGTKKEIVIRDFTDPSGDVYHAYQRADAALRAAFDDVMSQLTSMTPKPRTAQRPSSLYAVLVDGWKSYRASHKKP